MFIAKQYSHTGSRELRFSSFTEFLEWKEKEEENTYTTYVKGDRTYHPNSINPGKFIIKSVYMDTSYTCTHIKYLTLIHT